MPFKPLKVNVRNAVIALLAAIGLFMGYGSLRAVPNVADLNANPSLLTGFTYRNGELKGLDIRNAHIRNMTLSGVNAMGSKFTNVTFENCRFIKTYFDRSHFENVAFKNCVLEGQDDPNILDNLTNLRYSTMINVLFENTRFHNAWLVDIDGGGGYICFRNMRDFYPRGGPLDDSGELFFCGFAFFKAAKAHVRMIDCNLENASVSGSSLWARNSKFKNSTFRANYLYLDNIDLDIGTIVGQALVRVEKSRLTQTSFGTKGNTYLLHNIYRGKMGTGGLGNERYFTCTVTGAEKARTVVVHNDQSPAELSFKVGSVRLENIVLHAPEFYTSFDG